MGCSNPDLEKDTKSVAAKLSRLKNRLQTDKVGFTHFLISYKIFTTCFPSSWSK